MGEEGHVMLLLAGDLGCDLRVGRTFRTPQYAWKPGNTKFLLSLRPYMGVPRPPPLPPPNQKKQIQLHAPIDSNPDYWDPAKRHP